MPTDITFDSTNLKLAGQVYTPEGLQPGTRLPALVIGHPVTGVKEQGPALYAQRLVASGLVVLTFDAAYQGASEGTPHGLEEPFQRAEDFRNAVTYLTTRDDVDPERIGAIGICGAGGYVPYAAQTDHRLKAVATVSAVNITSFFRDPDPAGFQQLVEQSGALRTAEALGEPALLLGALPDELPAGAPQGLREFFDYYKTPRGSHPRSTNQWVARSADRLAQFDAFAEIARIAPRPLVMIAGTAAETRPFSVGAIAAAGENAELFEIDGATHVDLYDRDPYVAQAVTKLQAFFAEHLAAQPVAA
jgi:uncharacterized protein